MKSSDNPNLDTFSGVSNVQVILEGDKFSFELHTDGAVILEAAEEAGVDAPYSCRSGVCCSCRAKVLKGSASMQQNFTLSDEDMAEGYILTCQANPTSSEIIISFDD